MDPMPVPMRNMVVVSCPTSQEQWNSSISWWTVGDEMLEAKVRLRLSHERSMTTHVLYGLDQLCGDAGSSGSNSIHCLLGSFVVADAEVEPSLSCFLGAGGVVLNARYCLHSSIVSRINQ